MKMLNVIVGLSLVVLVLMCIYCNKQDSVENFRGRGGRRGGRGGGRRGGRRGGRVHRGRRGRRWRRRHRWYSPRYNPYGPNWWGAWGGWWPNWSWWNYAAPCMKGCVRVSDNAYGCVFPGTGPNECVFASDCSGCF